MHDVYLTSDQAADYLGIKERKLYELVGAGRIPATKVTGKWLFPRAALDRWLEAGLVIPPGYQPATPPMIIAGSQDPLLDWAARRSGSGLALLAEGSEAGLRHLERNEAALAAIHLHRRGGGDEDTNIAFVSASLHLADAVVIRFAAREQGLVKRPDSQVDTIAKALSQGLVFGVRQVGAGAQLLLEKVLAAEGCDIETIAQRASVYATGEDLAFGIASKEVDCGIATRAVAEQASLAFLPLVWEAFDLVVRRRCYFEPAPQKFFAFLRSEAFHDHARVLGGYKTEGAGEVKFNR